MPLFTFIAHYRGGTYTCQFSGDSLESVTRKWLDQMFIWLQTELIEEDKEEFIDQLFPESHTESIFTQINECKGVWRLYLLDSRDKTMEVHVILTEY